MSLKLRILAGKMYVSDRAYNDYDFWEKIVDAKSDFVRAVLGHFMFVFIHPYMDGNGRIGRFILSEMNYWNERYAYLPIKGELI